MAHATEKSMIFVDKAAVASRRPLRVRFVCAEACLDGQLCWVSQLARRGAFQSGVLLRALAYSLRREVSRFYRRSFRGRCGNMGEFASSVAAAMALKAGCAVAALL